jgi:hypothetical protein
VLAEHHAKQDASGYLCLVDGEFLAGCCLWPRPDNPAQQRRSLFHRGGQGDGHSWEIRTLNRQQAIF